MIAALHVAPVFPNVLLKQFPKVIFIKLILTNASIVVHVLMFVRLKPLALLN
jgi:hypothetical protein